MPKSLKPWLMCTLGLAMCGGVYSKTSQIHVLTSIGFGRLNYDKLPVLQFKPASFVDRTTRIRLQSLTLEVPLTATFRNDSGNDCEYFDRCSVRFCSGGLVFIASAPRVTQVRYRNLLDPQFVLRTQDEVALIEAAYSADAASASIWMQRSDADWLRQLLTIRGALPHCVQRVEIVRNEGIKGVLLWNAVEGYRTTIAFDYYSEDESLTGNALIAVNEKSKDEIALARALIASFRMPQHPAEP